MQSDEMQPEHVSAGLGSVEMRRVRRHSKRYRSRKAWQLALPVSAIVLLVGGTYAWWLSTHRTVTVHAVFTLTDRRTSLAGCVGTGQYRSINALTQAFLTDQSGRRLAVSNLGAGSANQNAATCTFTPTFEGVADTAATYTMNVAGLAGQVTLTKRDLVQGKQVLALSLDETTTVRVAFKLNDFATASASCFGSGKFSDISPATPVILRDQDNSIVATTVLGQGSGYVFTAYREGSCMYSTTLTKVPSSAMVLTLQVSNRPMYAINIHQTPPVAEYLFYIGSG